jgi:hypothetical protein
MHLEMSIKLLTNLGSCLLPVDTIWVNGQNLSEGVLGKIIVPDSLMADT